MPRSCFCCWCWWCWAWAVDNFTERQDGRKIIPRHILANVSSVTIEGLGMWTLLTVLVSKHGSGIDGCQDTYRGGSWVRRRGR